MHGISCFVLYFCEHKVCPGGGGGYFHMYAYWVCAVRETPIFSLKFLFRSISFSQMTKKIRSGTSPVYMFCRSGDHHFQNFFNFNPFTASHGRRPRLAAGQSARARRVLAVPETRIFTLKTAQARSGAPQVHAQNGSSSFRSPRIFTLDRGARSGARADFSLCRGT